MNVLFFDFAYREYLPIIEQVAALGFEPVMNQPRMRQLLEQRGVRCRGFEEFAAPDDASEVARATQKIGERVVETLQSPIASTAFDTDQGNLLLEGGSQTVRRMMELVRDQVYIVRVMERLIAAGDLRAVVMRSCFSAGQRALRAAAYKHGIPVLELSHGNPSWDPRLAPPRIQWNYAAYGDREVAVLAERSDQPERMVATGAPHWDALYRPENRPSRKEARSQLGLDPDRPLVVYAGTFATGRSLFFSRLARQHHATFDALAAAMGRLEPQPGLAIRPHPGESRQAPGRPPTPAEMKRFKAWASGKGVDVQMVDYSFSSLVAEKALMFRAADVVVSADPVSTVITEVMILDRPCVAFEWDFDYVRPYYREDDGLLFVRDADSLEQALRTALYDQDFRDESSRKMRQALPGLNAMNDGRSCVRIADLVAELGTGALKRSA